MVPAPRPSPAAPSPFCVLLLLLLLLLVLAQQTGAQSHYLPLAPRVCPYHELSQQDDANPFHSSPQALPDTGTNSCPMYTDTTCCQQAYLDQIASGSDPISVAIHRQFAATRDLLSAACAAYIGQTACIPCAPDGDVFVVWLPPYQDIRFCPGYCTSFYEACKDELVADERGTVSEVYSALDFCSDIFWPSDIWPTFVEEGQIGHHECYSPAVGSPDFDACDGDDMDFHYTECDEVSGTADLEFVWKLNSTCTGGYRLPNGVADIPCPIECPEGEYLPLGTTECATCPAGSFSLGGGHRVNKWDQWPTRNLVFTTYCLNATDDRIDAAECPGWKLQEDFVDSNIAGKNLTRSVLETRVELQHEGNVTFTLQVDGESFYDYGRFLIDGVATPNIYSEGREVTLTYGLEKGSHLLQWLYRKDYTVDQGEDAVYIFEITVTGMAHHNDYCSDCPMGSTSLAHSSSCVDCPLNTHTTGHGEAECVACADSEFALPGDRDCSPRLPCTVEDMQQHFTQCTTAHTRQEYYTWIEPLLCDPTALPLPAIAEVECAPCNAGHFRSGDECLLCPAGEASELGTEHACAPCDAGTFAPKALDLDRWDEWLYDITTSCTGECGTPGWRLHGDYVDSGVNHRSHATVDLQIPVEIVTAPHGEMRFDFEFECLGICHLEVLVNGDDVFYKFQAFDNDGSPEVHNDNVVDLPVGQTNITFVFSKYHHHPQDHVKLHNLRIEGVLEGGATECIECPPGSASSNAKSEQCVTCAPGQYAAGFKNLQCENCPVNTHSAVAESTECIPCGHGTETPEGSSTCSIGECQYHAPGSLDRYDLSPLQRTEMWGPVNENDVHFYYVDPCQRSGATECLNVNGEPLHAYACQHVVAYGHDVSLGDTLGYYPLDQAGEEGVILALTGGTPACYPQVPRALNVTMICDPLAGVGFPSAHPTAGGDVHADAAACTYALEWRSVYACPLCRDDHYEALLGPCVDGVQSVRYEWVANPRRCHTGVALPAATTQSCSSTQSCGPGTHLTPEDTCETCEVGLYSLGNHERYADGSESLGRLTLNGTCADCWHLDADGAYVSAGDQQGALFLETTFLSVDSAIEFQYQLFSAGESTFTFYIDDTPAFVADSTTLGWAPFSTRVTPLKHVFRWEFVAGAEQAASLRTASVRLKVIETTGTVAAVAACASCPAGRAPSPDRGDCVQCPLNMESVSGRCEGCSPSDYALPGDLTCTPRLPCGDADWISVIPALASSRCDADLSEVPSYHISFGAVAPQICTGSPPATITSTACIPCPYGTVLVAGLCSPCPAAQYFDATSASCSSVTEGHTSLPTASFFRRGDVLAGLPAPVATTCIGASCYTDGFHLQADGSLSTGFLAHDVTAVVEVDVAVLFTPGAALPRVSFELQRAAAPTCSLELYLNGVLSQLPSQKPDTTSSPTETLAFDILPLPASDSHTPTPSLIQFVVTCGASIVPSPVTISNLEITRASAYGGIGQVPCPAGSAVMEGQCVTCPSGAYSSEATNGTCVSCPPGSVTGRGSAKCTPCLATEVPAAGGNLCLPRGCLFQDGLTRFNLTLAPATLALTDKTQLRLSFCSPLPLAADADTAAEAVELEAPVFGLIEPLNGHSAELSLAIGGPDYTVSYSSAGPQIFFPSTAPVHGCSESQTGLDLALVCQLPEEGTSRLLLLSEPDACVLKVVWRDAAACSICQDTQYESEYTACSGGQQKLIHSRLPGARCNLPLLESEFRTCNSIEVDEFLGGGISIGVLVVVIAVTGLAIFFWKRKRDVEAKYEVLTNEVPLDAFEDRHSSLQVTLSDSSDSL